MTKYCPLLSKPRPVSAEHRNYELYRVQCIGKECLAFEDIDRYDGYFRCSLLNKLIADYEASQ